MIRACRRYRRARAVVNRNWQKKVTIVWVERDLSKKLHSQLGLIEDSLPPYKKGRTLPQGDSKNRILQGLTRLSNQILSASQRQTLEALTDAHALGCFE